MNNFIISTCFVACKGDGLKIYQHPLASVLSFSAIYKNQTDFKVVSIPEFNFLSAKSQNSNHKLFAICYLELGIY
jgi:hypothetical protein